jgi:hypothetical protein
MAEIEYTGAALVVHVRGWDRIWALKSQLTIPIEHVVGAESASEEARRWWHGLRMPGTKIPGVITAGTFYKDGGRVFWDVHDADRAVAIKLRDDDYTKLVVEVDDPAAVIALVNSVVQR